MEELSRQMFLEVVDLHNTQVHIYPIYFNYLSNAVNAWIFAFTYYAF